MTVAERVADGVAVLDEMNPGWAEGVDVETLVMSIDTCCVLGQVYGSYDRGVQALCGRHAGESSWDQEHGFTVEELDEPWEPLGAEWAMVILARQSAEAVFEFAETALD